MQQKDVTAVGFEPTPFQTSALNWRLRPLGQAITAWHTPLNYSQHTAVSLSITFLHHTITIHCIMHSYHTPHKHTEHLPWRLVVYYAPSISLEFVSFSISHIFHPSGTTPSLACFQFVIIGPKYITKPRHKSHVVILWLLQALKWGRIGKLEKSITRHIELFWSWQLGCGLFTPLFSTPEDFRAIGEGFINVKFLAVMKLCGHGRRGRGERTLVGKKISLIFGTSIDHS